MRLPVLKSFVDSRISASPNTTLSRDAPSSVTSYDVAVRQIEPCHFETHCGQIQPRGKPYYVNSLAFLHV